MKISKKTKKNNQKNNENNHNFADFLNKITSSGTIELNRQANILRAKGQNIISLGIGELNFNTPEHIKQAGIEAIKNNHNKYTSVPGILPLREVITKELNHKLNLGNLYTPDSIVVTCGAKQGIYFCLLSTINPGDEVIIPAPFWTTYPDLVKMCGGTPIIVPGKLTASGLKLFPEDLEKAITKKTKWFIFNSPTNPTGVVYTKTELLSLAQVLLKYPYIKILSDDIYEYLLYDKKCIEIIQAEPRLSNRTIIISGVSKTYAMTGWRVGYIASLNSSLISDVIEIQSQTLTCICSVAQYAAVAAFGEPKTFLENWIYDLKNRRNILASKLKSTKLITFVMPRGAFYIFGNISKCIGRLHIINKKIIKTDLDFVTELLYHYGVIAINGSSFGMSPYVRFTFSNNIDNIQKAGNKIIEFCNNLVIVK